MIEIIGPENSSEYEAAQVLRNLIIAAWRDVRLGKRHKIKIVAPAKCYGQRVRDIDLLVFADMQQQYTTASPHVNNQQVYIRNLCLTIEVKSHGPRKVRFIGNQVEVQYNGEWDSASEQSEQQKISVKRYLEQEGIQSPYIVNLIWLRGIPEKELPNQVHNIVGSDASWDTFMKRIALLQKPARDKRTDRLEIRASRNANYIEDVSRPFTKLMQPSRLDRQKMERITQSFLADQQYVEKLGNQLLIFRGRGGTGKTVRLLQLAHDLYDQKGSRVLILTYNKALVSDIKRLLTLMNISSGVSARSIDVKTVHSFLHGLLRCLGTLPSPCNDFLDRYSQYKAEALELMEAVEEKDIEELFQKRDFAWDFILVDEAQDWPRDERDLLFSVYNYRQFVLADGIDQLVRGHPPIDWREKVDRKNTQIVSLRKVLRLKLGLCMFVKSFARHVGIDHRGIEPYPEVPGGRVIVVEGGYGSNRVLHDEIVRLNLEDGNEPIDMLFCVPPGLAASRGRKYSVVGSKFIEWGYNIWDGTVKDIRGSPPRELDQLRIVQYDSCRGLEGWIVVNFQFDEFYDYKVRTYKPTKEEQSDLFFDRPAQARKYALRWLMIPLTRAMDTLVIQISSPDHYLAQILKEVANEYKDTVEWCKIDSRE